MKYGNYSIHTLFRVIYTLERSSPSFIIAGFVSQSIAWYRAHACLQCTHLHVNIGVRGESRFHVSSDSNNVH